MVSVADERAQLEIREKEMRDMIAKAEEKRSWFAAFRDWVESVATFLDEKVCSNVLSLFAVLMIHQYPQLEKLEEEHVSLLQERYGMVSKRRSACRIRLAGYLRDSMLAEALTAHRSRCKLEMKMIRRVEEEP